MLHGPHQFQSQGLGRAFDHTYAAPVALFRVNDCFVSFGRGLPFHVDGTKLASIHTDLAPITEILVDNGSIATLVSKVITIIDYGTKLYAAVRAAKAEVTNRHSSTRGGNETCFPTDVQDLTGFLDADSSSYASIDYVLHRSGGQREADKSRLIALSLVHPKPAAGTVHHSPMASASFKMVSRSS